MTVSEITSQMKNKKDNKESDRNIASNTVGFSAAKG